MNRSPIFDPSYRDAILFLVVAVAVGVWPCIQQLELAVCTGKMTASSILVVVLTTMAAAVFGYGALYRAGCRLQYRLVPIRLNESFDTGLLFVHQNRPVRIIVRIVGVPWWKGMLGRAPKFQSHGQCVFEIQLRTKDAHEVKKITLLRGVWPTRRKWAYIYEATLENVREISASGTVACSLDGQQQECVTLYFALWRPLLFSLTSQVRRLLRHNAEPATGRHS